MTFTGDFRPPRGRRAIWPQSYDAFFKLQRELRLRQVRLPDQEVADTLFGLFDTTIRLESRVLVAESFNQGRDREAFRLYERAIALDPGERRWQAGLEAALQASSRSAL